MEKTSVRTLFLWILGVSIVFWGFGVPILQQIPGNEPASIDLFRILNPAVLAMGVSLLIAISPAIIDMFKNWTLPITGAQLLITGGLLNWIGVMARMGRWYVWGELPNLAPVGQNGYVMRELWVYNVGLWATLVGGALLLASIDYADPDRDFTNIKRAAALIGFAVGGILLYIQFFGGPPILFD